MNRFDIKGYRSCWLRQIAWFGAGMLCLLVMKGGPVQGQEPPQAKTSTSQPASEADAAETSDSSLESLREQFHGADSDSNDRISEAELLSGLPEEAQARWKRDMMLFDVDGDQSLDFQEYISMPGISDVAHRMAMPDPILEAFEKEWTRLQSAAGESVESWTRSSWKALPSGPWKLPPFDFFDLDHDGTLPRDEAKQGLSVFFGITDRQGTALRRKNGLVFFWRRYVLESDKNRDRRMSREEVLNKFQGNAAEREAQFTAIDKNADGVLSVAELTQDPSTWQDVINRFRTWDKDFDARLSPEELSQNIPWWEGGYADWLFPGFDEDGDGLLSLKEFRMTPLANELLIWTGRQKDRNDDGRLSRAEFHPQPDPAFGALSKMFFDRLDRNADKFLDVGEFRFQMEIDRVSVPAILQALDQDGDQSLSQDELFSRAGLPEEKSPVWYEQEFHRADRDHNQLLNREEFEANRQLLHAMLVVRSVPVTLLPRFRLLDTDQDDLLTWEELQASSPKGQHAKLHQEFLICDGDESGALTLWEYSSLPSVGPIWRRGPVRDPVAEICEDTLQKIIASLEELPSKNWAPAVITKLPGLTSRETQPWDTDRDGTLSESELRRGVEVAFGVIHPISGLHMRRLNGQVFHWRNMRFWDTNYDGRLSESEFMSRFRQGKFPDQAKRTFASADKNSDGSLSVLELATVNVFWSNVINEFQRFDQDRSGRIDASEIKNAAKPWESVIAQTALPQFDRDDDGMLSFWEFRLTPFGNVLAGWNRGRRDQNHDGYLSLVEYHQDNSPALIGLSEIFFHRLDQDHDNRLGMREMTFQVDFTRIPRSLAFQALDQDGNLVLTLSEATSRVGSRPSDPNQQRTYEIRLMRLEDAFRSDDKNHDGELTMEEFQAPTGKLTFALSGRKAPTRLPPNITQADLVDESLWDWKMIGLVGFNILLLGGVGWYVLKT